MGNWREVAAAVAHRPEPTSAPSVETFGLPNYLAANLWQLETMAVPGKLEIASNWRRVVDDALRLARDGWAASALGLGWTPHDIYGVGPVNSHEFEGLAVWLAGRRIVMIDSKVAVAAQADGRVIFIRGGAGHGVNPTVKPVFLWQFGRNSPC